MNTAASASNGRSSSSRLGGASEGFAIPINRALSIAKTLETKGTGSPAETAGLTAGDTIVRVDGTTVQSADDLVSALGQHQAGHHVSVRWITADGTAAHATVTL